MRSILSVSFAAILAGSVTFGQTSAPSSGGYLVPPKAIVEIMTAEPIPNVTVSPSRELSRDDVNSPTTQLPTTQFLVGS